MYKALVATAIVRPHPKSDNGLKLININGYQVISGADIKNGDIVIFFEAGGVMDTDLLAFHNEFRSKLGLNDNQQSLRAQFERPALSEDEIVELHRLISERPGGFFEENARIRSIKLRGERSEGFVVTPQFFAHLNPPENFFIPGHTFDTIGDKKICWKYVSPATRRQQAMLEKQSGRKLGLDMFHAHYDTENLRHIVNTIPDGARVIITEKLHGSSGRTGNVLVDEPLAWWQRLLAYVGVVVRPNRSWKSVTGTRNVVRFVGEEPDLRPDLAGEDQSVRWEIHRELAPKLQKGETVYYEIVGHWENGTPIFKHAIPEDDIGKEIYKAYKNRIPSHWGRNFHYVYGLAGNAYAVYVYRITQTNVDGQSVDLGWEQIQRRCKILGLRTVPEISHGTLWADSAGYVFIDNAVRDPSNRGEIEEPFLPMLDLLGARPSTLDPRHISEGVCVRIEHPEMEKTAKYKGFNFCHLEGIRKNSDDYIDPEEAA
jgi:hypothetical protein